jgi:glycosyltransferase involved in cell wall biosynthesis
LIKISVVTPVLNGEKYIQHAVESVLSQGGNFELEYIVRDGLSTDRTLQILEQYKDRIRLFSQKDGSPQEAINAGMSVASGDIGCWLNADDTFEPGALQKVVDGFRKNPEKDWLYGRCSIIDENGKEIRKPITIYKNILGYFYSRNVLLCENFINQPATFWKMSLWHECNKLDHRFKAAWDYELWMMMASKSQAIPVRDYLAKFRRHHESISEQDFARQFAEELEIAKKYGNKFHCLIHKFNQVKIVAIYRLLQGA